MINIILHPSRTTEFTLEEEELILELYSQNTPITQIAKKIDDKCTDRIITGFLKRKGVYKSKNQKKNFNINYFDIIDSEDKAYWLGFSWSDGNILKRNREGRREEYCFKLALSQTDQEHLEKFREYLKGDFKILNYKTKGFCDEDKYHTTAEIRLYNKHFCQNLYNNYNLVPYRTDIDWIKQKVPGYLLNHFIRGVFDAEGNVSHYFCEGTEKIIVSFTTTNTINEFINEYLFENQICNSILKPHIRHKDGDGNCITKSYCGFYQGVRVLDFLYEGATIYLNRKYCKYLEIKESEKQRLNTSKDGVARQT